MWGPPNCLIVSKNLVSIPDLYLVYLKMLTVGPLIRLSSSVEKLKLALLLVMSEAAKLV
jgi:hypothetical protein